VEKLSLEIVNLKMKTLKSDWHNQFQLFWPQIFKNIKTHKKQNFSEIILTYDRADLNIEKSVNNETAEKD
jgi:hypothetical protein